MQRSILVTGGSRGIGAATVVALAERDYAVAVNFAHDSERAAEVVELARAHGVQAIAVRADVADEAQVVAMFERIDTALPPLGGLVNNAGVLFSQSGIAGMDAARIRRVLDVNVVGPMVCIREAAQRMSTRNGHEGGAIVNVSSIASTLGGPNEYVDYAASKGALDTLTIGLAKELAPDGIRVNGVRPGIIDTEIHASGGEPERAHRMASTIPLGRPGTAVEVARAIVWLIGPEASYVTGAIVDVAGGR